jgi:hypothetical protein
MSDETEQVTSEQLESMSPQDIVTARRQGRLHDLLTGEAVDPTGNPVTPSEFTPSVEAPGGGHTYASVSAWLQSLSPAQVRQARQQGHIPGVQGASEARRSRYGMSSAG